ncbi:rod shape-determining protein MreC [Paenibacillus dendritiformis]|uniref:rod shape-determining protein MreC n=1 Tax=Paenibacillus dendritiformis TaxID=130049 RepID=UPI0018CFE2A2|nr:rod shape-determining protein MreC [Paenibacillus dendritiformis]
MRLFKLLGNKRLIILLFGLILFIALMGFTLGGRLKMSWPEKIVHDTVTFVQQLVYKPASYIANFFHDIATLKELHEENERLKIVEAHYIRDKAYYSEVQATNERLREALNFTERQKQLNLPYEYRIAQVSSINVADPFNQTLNLNLGEINGVRQGMPVISVDNGVVGTISRVYEFSSTVQLLTNLDEKDPNSRPISATVLGKSDSFGMIESYDHSSGTFTMTRIEENDKVKVGDTVISSGFGGVFPGGLIIGTVVSLQQGDLGLTRTATIEPAATYRDWRELFIVFTPDPEENGSKKEDK